MTREEVLAGLRAMRDEDCWFDDEEEIIAGAIALLAQPAASEPKP